MHDIEMVDLALGLAIHMADFSPDQWAEILKDAELSLDDMRALAVAMKKQNDKE